MGKKIIVDSYYYSDTVCYTVGVVFDDWGDRKPRQVVSTGNAGFQPYKPGQFWKRELPGILKVLKWVNLKEFDTVIIDGYCRLHDRSGRMRDGLGAVLWNVIRLENPDISVIGCAKTLFGCDCDAYEKVYRGRSKNPLYVTSCGPVGYREAADLIRSMHGRYRIPSLIRLCDDETRKWDGSFMASDWQDRKPGVHKGSVKYRRKAYSHRRVA